MGMTVTLGDVERVAKDLIRVNGVTTTLEVKEQLRREGFWAVQREVSDFMAVTPGLDFATNGSGYREYFVNDPEPDTDEDDIPPITSQDEVEEDEEATAAENVAEAKSELEVGDYDVTDSLGWDVRTYTEVTRGQAKYLWVKETGNPFFEARTHKLN